MLQKKNTKNFISLIVVVLFLAVVLVLDQVIKPTHKMSMLLTVLQNAVYTTNQNENIAKLRQELLNYKVPEE